MQRNIQKTIGTLAGHVLLGMLALPTVAATQVLSPCAGLQSGQGAACQACTGCEVVREIDDPHTGQHWILMRDAVHPGGPGALVLEGSLLNGGRFEAAINQVHPVIRAGDRVTVEQSSAKFDLKLGGIALYPAAQDAPLKVLLEISGKVVPAAVLGPGRTVLIAEKEFRP
jgi:hypothetical protein